MTAAGLLGALRSPEEPAWLRGLFVQLNVLVMCRSLCVCVCVCLFVPHSCWEGYLCKDVCKLVWNTRSCICMFHTSLRICKVQIRYFCCWGLTHAASSLQACPKVAGQRRFDKGSMPLSCPKASSSVGKMWKLDVDGEKAVGLMPSEHLLPPVQSIQINKIKIDLLWGPQTKRDNRQPPYSQISCYIP